MNWWAELVSDNPMLVEISRFRSRMLSNRDGGSNRAVIVLLLVFYAMILVTILRFARDIDPIWIVLGQTVLFLLLAPVMSAGTIAGERERRTWEILLTAPVTKPQIVSGKFIAILTGYGFYLLAFGLMIASCLIANPMANWGMTLNAEGLSITFAILLISLSLLVSARSRTTFAAIGACVGIVFVVYVALPVFISAMFNRAGSDILYTTYPLATIAKLATLSDRSYGGSFDGRAWDSLRWTAPLEQDVAFLAIAVLLLVATTVTIRRMEEIKDFMTEPDQKAAKTNA